MIEFAVSRRGIHRRFSERKIHTGHLHTLLRRIGHPFIYGGWTTSGDSLRQLRWTMAVNLSLEPFDSPAPWPSDTRGQYSAISSSRFRIYLRIYS